MDNDPSSPAPEASEVLAKEQFCSELAIIKNARASGVWFRVEAPVTRRSPHRPVREGFPHTVPRFRLFYQVVNQSGDTPIGA